MKFMKVVTQHLSAHNVQVLMYKDDWLIQSPLEAQCCSDTATVLKLCHEKGFKVNEQKSDVIPFSPSPGWG